MALKILPQGSRHTEICRIEILNQVHQIAIEKLIVHGVILGRALNEQVLLALGILDDLFNFIYSVS